MSRIQVEERYYNAFGKSLELSRDKSKTGHTFASKDKQPISDKMIISPSNNKTRDVRDATEGRGIKFMQERNQERNQEGIER